MASALMRAWLVPVALISVAMPNVARAQVGDDLAIQPSIPQGFDRGRNVSVQARARPSYTPTGIRAGGFLVYPRLRTSAGGTTNAYLTSTNAIETPFVTVEPSVRASSDWSRHSLTVSGSTRAREFIGQGQRRERIWRLGADGDLELGREYTISFEMDSSQNFESQFSGEVASNVAAVSRYRRDYSMIRGQYEAGRARAFIVADAADYRFRPVPLNTGGFRDQSDRNRNVRRVIGQVEYARTPSISLFAQVGYTETEFDGRRVFGSPFRDSSMVRAMGGFNVDIAGRARGTVGIGYGIRDYRAAGFDTIRGLSGEAQVELFPTELFTITAGAQRTIEDSSVGTLAAFFDSRLSLRGDYEVLHNLILSARGEYSQQDYIGTEQSGRTYRAETSARYLISRRMTLDASLSYANRSSDGDIFTNRAKEGRVEAGLTFHI